MYVCISLSTGSTSLRRTQTNLEISRQPGKLNSNPPEERWEIESGKLGEKEVINLKAGKTSAQNEYISKAWK